MRDRQDAQDRRDAASSISSLPPLPPAELDPFRAPGESRDLAYVSIHNHSCYSILDSCCSIDALIERAVDDGMTALGLVDHDSLSGAVQFVQGCARAGIRPIVGAELTLEDKAGRPDQLVVLCENNEGYRNLCRLLTRETHEFRPLPSWKLVERSAGLIALSGCGEGRFGRLLLEGRSAEAIDLARYWQTVFGRENFYAELFPAPSAIIDRVALAAGDASVPLLASANVHFENDDHRHRYEVLSSIRTLTLLREPNLAKRELGWGGAFQTQQEADRLFGHWPESLASSLHIADRCHLEVFEPLMATA